MKSLILVTLSLIFVSGTSFAGKEGGGGAWTEGDLKHFLLKLVPYIKSPEGKALFPEVVVYDQRHPHESFSDILNELNPILVKHPVYDRGGNERDCVSGKNKVRFFKCNLNALPQKPDQTYLEGQKSEYYGSLYRLVLHEAFVQAGLEKALSKEIPSEYPLASRLSVHLENFPEWVPGSNIKRDDTYMTFGGLQIRVEPTSPILIPSGAPSPYFAINKISVDWAGPETLEVLAITIKSDDDPQLSWGASGDRLSNYFENSTLTDNPQGCSGSAGNSVIAQSGAIAVPKPLSSSCTVTVESGGFLMEGLSLLHDQPPFNSYKLPFTVTVYGQIMSTVGPQQVRASVHISVQ